MAQKWPIRLYRDTGRITSSGRLDSNHPWLTSEAEGRRGNCLDERPCSCGLPSGADRYRGNRDGTRAIRTSRSLQIGKRFRRLLPPTQSISIAHSRLGPAVTMSSTKLSTPWTPKYEGESLPAYPDFVKMVDSGRRPDNSTEKLWTRAWILGLAQNVPRAEDALWECVYSLWCLSQLAEADVGELWERYVQAWLVRSPLCHDSLESSC